MKIAHFVSNFPINSNSEIYGKSLAAYNICLNLAKRGHEIHVFTISQDNEQKIEYHKNLIIHRYKPLISYRSEGFSLEILKDPISYDFDIVHVHSGISITVLAGYKYSVKKKVPLILTWHGDSIRGYGRYRGIIPGFASFLYKHVFVNKLLKLAEFIISPSESYIKRSTFLANYRNKIVVIPNGIDLNEFSISCSKRKCKEILNLTGKTIILFVGSLYSLKGPQVLLESASEILNENENENLIFVFMGGGDVEKFKNLSEKLKIGNKVKFLGYTQGTLKIKYYKAADIFVLPSIEAFEIFGIVNLEAMASSTPIIASDIGGIPDLVKDGFNGLLVPPRDQNSLSNAIVSLLKNDKLRRRMGLNGKDFVQNYSWQKIALKTENLYYEIID